MHTKWKKLLVMKGCKRTSGLVVLGDQKTKTVILKNVLMEIEEVLTKHQSHQLAIRLAQKTTTNCKSPQLKFRDRIKFFKLDQTPRMNIEVEARC